MCPNKLNALSDHFGSLGVRSDYWFCYAGASLYLYLLATRSGGSCHSGLLSTLIQLFLLFYCNLICREQLNLKCFRGGRAFMSILGRQVIRSPDLSLIGILVRSSFLLFP